MEAPELLGPGRLTWPPGPRTLNARPNLPGSTFVCPTEITAFSDNIEKFRALNAEVIGVSIDSKFSHLAWINTPREQGGLGETRFPLVADVTKAIARKYNVLIEEDGIALRFDAQTPGRSSSISRRLSDRVRACVPLFGRTPLSRGPSSGTFIIDDKGILRHINVNDNNIGRSIEENLRLLQAIQFAAKHGEVCPANWKPGEATVRPPTRVACTALWTVADPRCRSVEGPQARRRTNVGADPDGRQGGRVEEVLRDQVQEVIHGAHPRQAWRPTGN